MSNPTPKGATASASDAVVIDHEFKSHPSVYAESARGEKLFEYRRDDRGGYEVGQTVRIRCFLPLTGCYTDDPPLDRRITNVLRGGEFELPQGFCVLGLTPLGAALSPPPAVPESVRRLSEAATQGEWSIWPEPIADADEAVRELALQVSQTDPLADHLFLLNAGGKCPATTGCGPTSEANAAFIVALVNWFRSLSTPSGRADTPLVSGGAVPEGLVASITEKAKGYDTPSEADPRRRFTPAQIDLAIRAAYSAGLAAAPAAPEPAAGGENQALRDALHLCLGELDWQASATNRCGDPGHECPLQDCDNPDDRHLLARMAARSALSAPAGAQTAGGEGLCAHPETAARDDHVVCLSCGMIRTGIAGWTVAKKRWFRDIDEARFFEKHGRLPEPAPPSSTATAHDAPEGGR